MKTLISEEFEWDAREYGSAFNAYEIHAENWFRRIPSGEEQWADIEAQFLTQTQDMEEVEDCPPLAMLIVILAGVATTSAIVAFIALGG